MTGTGKVHHHQMTSFPLLTSSDGRLLLKSAAFPRMSATESCWKSLCTVTLSSSPVCRANALPNFVTWAVAVSCQDIKAVQDLCRTKAAMFSPSAVAPPELSWWPEFSVWTNLDDLNFLYQPKFSCEQPSQPQFVLHDHCWGSAHVSSEPDYACFFPFGKYVKVKHFSRGISKYADAS